MDNTCCFCSNALDSVHIAGSLVRICTKCGATFLTSGSFSNLKQALSDNARQQWMEILLEKVLNFQENPNPLCLDHNQPLVLGKMPDVGIQGRTANCCKLLHLTPENLAQLWQRSLAISRHSIQDLKSERKSITVRVVSSLLKIFGMEEKPVDDGLDDIIWDTKLLPILRKN